MNILKRPGLVLLLALGSACAGETPDEHDDATEDVGSDPTLEQAQGVDCPTPPVRDAGVVTPVPDAGPRPDAATPRPDAGTIPPGTCTPGTPPAALVNTLDLTWKEMSGGFEGRTGARPRSASIANFKNTILDQAMENGGQLNYCVRYESTVPVSAALRDKIAAALQRGVDAWFSKLKGYNCFPHERIKVNVTGWAVRNRQPLGWTDDSVRVDVNNIYENAPGCLQTCGRFFNQQPGFSYPQCPGGRAAHYDTSLWLTEGMGNGGAGGDWGQRLDRANFTSTVDSPTQHIYWHELGHGFGFPDYYNWDAWAPGVAVPNSIMVAGLATNVTEWDSWLIRQTWDRLKPRWR